METSLKAGFAQNLVGLYSIVWLIFYVFTSQIMILRQPTAARQVCSTRLVETQSFFDRSINKCNDR